MIRHPLFRFFASLKLAVVNILALSAVLAVATILESLYGMRSVYLLVYGTPWFGGLLFLLGLNVLCAAFSRYPWKKHQTGFVVTHAGIIMLLFGSWLTQKYGVDGNLPVFEGQPGNEVILSEHQVRLADISGRNEESFPAPESALKQSGELMKIALSGGYELVGVEYLPRLVNEPSWVASGVEGLGSPAIELELYNSRFRVHQWLAVKEADVPATVNFGPASVYFERLWNAADEKRFATDSRPKPKAKTTSKGHVEMQVGGANYRFTLEELQKDWQRLGKTGFQTKLDKYFPYAVVEGNELKNRGPEPLNPAAQILVRNVQGLTEKHTIFANYPEFATLHRKELPEGHKAFGVKLSLVMAGSEHRPEGTPSGQGELKFVQSADGKTLKYRSKGKIGDLKGEGVVKVGEPMATGWMDLEFVVKQWLPYGVESDQPRYVETISGGDSNFLSGIKFEVRRTKGRDVSFDEPDTAGMHFWLSEGGTKPLSIGGRDYLISYGKEKLLLPFVVFLDKFTMGTNPGTNKAASYESRVTVIDDTKGTRKSSLISMNEPMVHAGYTFYQASYALEDGKPPMSVFSVNRDIGRWVKYLGSLIIVLGAALMFWMNPHYWGKIFGYASGRSAKAKESV